MLGFDRTVGNWVKVPQRLGFSSSAKDLKGGSVIVLGILLGVAIVFQNLET